MRPVTETAERPAVPSPATIAGRARRRRIPRILPRLGAIHPTEQAEAELSALFEDYVADGRSGLIFALRYPGRCMRGLRVIAGLPRAVGEVGDGVEAAAIREVLRARGLARLLSGAKCVLTIPSDATEYTLGSSKQTLRRKVRAARGYGITWAPVEGEAARRSLVVLAEKQEREHPLEEYRQTDPRNDDLFDYALWLVALAADGTPLLLSVTTADGDWATLRYFRVLGEGQEHSVARYLMTQVLVEQLARRGVRYLVDTQSPWNLANGLRHFQRMLGWRVVVPVVGRSPRLEHLPAHA